MVKDQSCRTAELALRLSHRVSGLTKKQALVILDALADLVIELVIQENRTVWLGMLGKFRRTSGFFHLKHFFYPEFVARKQTRKFKEN